MKPATSRIIEQYPRRSLAWRIVTVAMIIYAVALALFAALPLLPPPNPYTPVEIAITITGVLSAIGLTLRLLLPKGKRERWGHYAYLFTAAAGFATFIAFNLGATEAAIELRAVFATFICSGMLGAVGAHLEYGGSPSIEDVLSEHRLGSSA